MVWIIFHMTSIIFEKDNCLMRNDGGAVDALTTMRQILSPTSVPAFSQAGSSSVDSSVGIHKTSQLVNVL